MGPVYGPPTRCTSKKYVTHYAFLGTKQTRPGRPQSAQTPALFSELLSFRTFGHGGASGCQVVADPEQGLVVVVLTNTHLRVGYEPWYARLQSMIACTVASIS
jgi:hypothetical protein